MSFCPWLRYALAAGVLCAASWNPIAAQGAPATTPGGRDNRRDAIVRAVEKVGPAVVNISTETRVENPYSDSNDFFSQFFGMMQPSQPRVAHALGSGVIIDGTEGYVLTNDHVVDAASKITVTLGDDRQFPATVIGADTHADLALLKLKGKGPWPAVPMGRSDDLMIGETVIAIGNPFGLSNTVTTGVLSATGRTVTGPDQESVPYADFLQTDAAINPGNSGGALLNINGELVGINAAINARGQNLGFSIPIDRARLVVRELLRYGRVRPVWTGMAVQELDAQMAQNLDLPPNQRGVVVSKTFPDAPAQAAGLRAGDVLVRIGDQKVGSIADYDTALAKVPAGSTVSVRALRDGSEVSRTVAVQAFPMDKAPAYAWDVLGISVANVRGGVVIDRVKRDGYLGRRKLPAGLQLVEFNGREIGKAQDFYDLIPEALYRPGASLAVSDGRGLYRVTVPVR